MNIVIYGAGAIGSLFGAMLSNHNDVFLIGRKSHVESINKNGLVIKDKTKLKVKINAETKIEKIPFSPDLLILTVKSYDTESAIIQAKKIIQPNTTVLSLQNGLDNIETLKKHISSEQIIAGVTTHGVTFSEPGMIKHTGIGSTVIGEIDGNITERIKDIENQFNTASIETNISQNILREIWVKAIINSSINPLTTFFKCKNGYLLENPILEKIVEKIVEESTSIANVQGIDLRFEDMINKTKSVIKSTKENYSSMLQSYKKGKKTEIDSINGKIADIGIKNKIKPILNQVLVYSIKSICK
jgi:2-dehydropantoate 2-reductase